MAPGWSTTYLQRWPNCGRILVLGPPFPLSLLPLGLFLLADTPTFLLWVGFYLRSQGFVR